MGKEKLSKDSSFSKKNLDSFKFILDSATEYVLIYSNLFLGARKIINLQYHSACCRTYVDCFRILISGKRNGEEKHSETPPLLHYYFFFSKYCHVLFHRRFCSATSNWRELYKNLTILNSLDANTKN